MFERRFGFDLGKFQPKIRFREKFVLSGIFSACTETSLKFISAVDDFWFKLSLVSHSDGNDNCEVFSDNLFGFIYNYPSKNWTMRNTNLTWGMLF